jgi:CheY-like chemotaxis protein
MQGNRVLLMEDEPEARQIHALALRHAGYEVLEAADGLEAVQTAHEQLPDLILLDLRLPGMQGCEAVNLIRMMGEWGAHLPVIALSAYGLPESATGLPRAAGFDGFFAKPVDPQQVVKVVRQWLGPGNVP